MQWIPRSELDRGDYISRIIDSEIGKFKLPVSNPWRLAAGHIQLTALPFITIRKSASFSPDSLIQVVAEWISSFKIWKGNIFSLFPL